MNLPGSRTSEVNDGLQKLIQKKKVITQQAELNDG